MKYALLPFLLLAASCGADQQHDLTVSKSVTAPAKVEPVDTTPIDYSRLKENLPGSQYYFSVRVFDVKFQTVKNAFEQRKDAYSVPTAVSGKRLSFGLEMTNPYNEAMNAPIPDYFRLQAACFDLGEHGGQTYTSYNRTSHVYELGAGDVTTAKGGSCMKFPATNEARMTGRNCRSNPIKPDVSKSFLSILSPPIAVRLLYLALPNPTRTPGSRYILVWC